MLQIIPRGSCFRISGHPKQVFVDAGHIFDENFIDPTFDDTTSYNFKKRVQTLGLPVCGLDRLSTKFFFLFEKNFMCCVIQVAVLRLFLTRIFEVELIDHSGCPPLGYNFSPLWRTTFWFLFEVNCWAWLVKLCAWFSISIDLKDLEWNNNSWLYDSKLLKLDI